MALRPVDADRLALALADPQPGDEPRAEQKADEQSRGARRAGTEADVADKVEDPGEAELLGDQVEHDTPLTTRSTSLASPIEFDAFTRTPSPGLRACDSRSAASSTLSAKSTSTAPPSAFASGAISSPIKINRSTRALSTSAARAPWSASLCSPSSRMGPSTAMRRAASFSSPKLFSVAAIEAGLAL